MTGKAPTFKHQLILAVIAASAIILAAVISVLFKKNTATQGATTTGSNSPAVNMSATTTGSNSPVYQIGPGGTVNQNNYNYETPQPAKTNLTTEQQIGNFSKIAAARHWEPPELPKDALRFGKPAADIKFGGIMMGGYAVGTEDHPSVPPVILPSGIVFTPYVKNNRIYIKAETPFGDSAKTVEMNNEWPAKIPDGWDRNFNENSFEIVDDSQLPVFQIRYDSPQAIEIYGVLVSDGGEVTIAFGDSASGQRAGAPIPKLPNRKAWFKYPSNEHLGDLADQ